MSEFEFDQDAPEQSKKQHNPRDLGLRKKPAEEHGDSKPVRRSISSVNRRQTSMSRSRLSETMTRSREAYEDLLKNPNHTNDPERHKVLVFDREKHQAPYSGLIHCTMDVEHNGKKVVAYHFLLLAGSSDVEEFGLKKVDGREVNIYTSPADTYNVNFRKKVAEMVRINFHDHRLVSAGFQVIPRDTKLYQDEDVLKDVGFFATSATNYYINVLHGEEPFNVEGWINPHTDTIRARVEYNPEPCYSATGLPVRSDARVLLTSITTTDHGHTTNNLAQVDTYVDLVLDADSNIGGFGGMYGNRNQPEQPYRPRIVLSRIDNLTDIVSPETQLLALISATVMTRNHMYTGVWRPRKHLSDKEDFRNIGAVNFELDLENEEKPSKIPVKEDSFTDGHVYNLIQAVVKPEPMISMVVEDGNELTWLQSIFLKAATSTGTELTTAQEAIRTAADNLTGGRFTELYGNEALIFCEHDGNQLHRGYFVADGEKRDIREIDRLAMLNMYGERDMNTVDAYMATFEDIDTDNDLRMDIRRQLLIDAVGEVHLHGKGDLLNIDIPAMECLIQAAADAGLAIDPSNVSKEFNVTARGRSGLGRFAATFKDNNLFTQRAGSRFGRDRNNF